MSPAITPVELSRRLTRVNIAYTVARMQVIEARSGQPVEVRRFAEAAAGFPRRRTADRMLRHRTAIAGALHPLHLDALTENTRCPYGLLRSAERRDGRLTNFCLHGRQEGPQSQEGRFTLRQSFAWK